MSFHDLLRTWLRQEAEVVLEHLLPEHQRVALAELGGPRWGQFGSVFALPAAEPDRWIVVSAIVGGGGTVGFNADEIGAPAVYDFARFADAVACAAECAVERRSVPRTTHRWCRRCVQGEDPVRRSQFLNPDALGRIAPRPVPHPRDLGRVLDEDDGGIDA